MSKKKGLGRDVNNSLETIKDTLEALDDFVKMPLKEGLLSNNVDADEIHKAFNKTSEHAYALINMVKDLRTMIKGVKLNRSSRFASQVVQRFLSQQG